MIILTSHAEAAEQLASHAFIRGSANRLFNRELTKSSSWRNFADSWHDLRLDEYMADGGLYRFRRYSEFQIDPTGHAMSPLPHVPYRQTKQDNYLNGGIDRIYHPIRDDIQINAAFADVLFACSGTLAVLHPTGAWRVQVFQNRIFAKPGETGKPTPEGIHRDGVDYVLTLMVQRQNVDGGESFSYAEDGQTLKDRVMLKEPGDFIFLDDKRMKHAVHPISRAKPDEDGYRDVLVAMFVRLENSHANT